MNFSLLFPVTHSLSAIINCSSHSTFPTPYHEDDGCFHITDVQIFTIRLAVSSSFRRKANCLLGIATYMSGNF